MASLDLTGMFRGETDGNQDRMLMVCKHRGVPWSVGVHRGVLILTAYAHP